MEEIGDEEEQKKIKKTSELEKKKGEKYTAMYDHEPLVDDELPLKTGDLITLIAKDDSGWWLGELENGKKGVFASNYVKTFQSEKYTVVFDHKARKDDELTIKVGDDVNLLIKDATGWWFGELSDGKRGLFPGNYVKKIQNQKYVVLFDREARKDDELTIKVGDIVNLVVKDDSGWWLGELPNGKKGFLPSNHVRKLEELNVPNKFQRKN